MSMISAPSSSSRMNPLARPMSDRARGRNRALRRRRAAKIVATLGPASDSPERLRALFDAGVDVFRLNFSHGSHAQKKQLFDDIRRVESDTGRPIGILADLQGPKLRVGDFADWVALSFVQRPDDVAEGRKLIGNRAGLMVKLEKPAAIKRLDEIIELSDALMVARGDLGVEMPPEDVPSVQKQVIHACRLAGKPVIVATQMLESMITAPTPTRAEASDVATAVYEGADAVMLSAETAVGQYPIKAVTMMDRIARRVQEDPLYFSTLEAGRMPPEHTNHDAISP